MGSALKAMINPMSILTIGVIAGGAALVQWAFKAEDAEEKTKSLAERLKEARANTKELVEELRRLQLGMTEEEVALFDAVNKQRQLIADLQKDAERAGYIQRDQLEDHIIPAEKERLRLLQGELSELRAQQSELDALKNSADDMSEAHIKIWENSGKTKEELERTQAYADLLQKDLTVAQIAALELAEVSQPSRS